MESRHFPLCLCLCYKVVQLRSGRSNRKGLDMANESSYFRGGVEENRRRVPEPGTHAPEPDQCRGGGVLFYGHPNAAGPQRTGDDFLPSCHWTGLSTSVKAKCSDCQLKQLRESARNQAPRIKHSRATVAAFATWAIARYAFCTLRFYVVHFPVLSLQRIEQPPPPHRC